MFCFEQAVINTIYLEVLQFISWSCYCFPWVCMWANSPFAAREQDHPPFKCPYTDHSWKWNLEVPCPSELPICVEGGSEKEHVFLS